MYTVHPYKPHELPSDVKQFIHDHTDSCFLSYEWFELLTNTVVNNDQQVTWLVCTDQQGACHAVLPLWIQANELKSLVNYYTPIFEPIVLNTDTCQEPLKAIAKTISQWPTPWTACYLYPINHSQQVFDVLASAFKQAGLFVNDYFNHHNWYLPIKALSFEQYVQSRPSRLKNTYKRKSKKILNDDQYQLIMYRDGTDLEKAIKDYNDIYHLSWKVDEPYPDFIPGLIRLAADKGWLRLGIMYHQGKAIAAHFWLVDANKASIYKLAYDPDYAKQSVGTVLTMWMIEQCFTHDAVTEVDYLIGNEPYKKDWMTECREFHGLEIINTRSLKGKLIAFKLLVKRPIRR